MRQTNLILPGVCPANGGPGTSSLMCQGLWRYRMVRHVVLFRDTLIGKELKRESKNPREAVRPVYGKEMVKGGKEAWITG